VKTAEAPPSVSLRPIQAAFIACSPWPNHLIGRDSAACPGSGVAPSSAGAWTSARTIRWRARAPGSQSVSRSAGRNLARDWKWLVSIANVTHHASARYRLWTRSIVVAAHHRLRMSMVVTVHHRPTPPPYSGWSTGTSPVWRIFPSPLCCSAELTRSGEAVAKPSGGRVQGGRLRDPRPCWAVGPKEEHPDVVSKTTKPWSAGCTRRLIRATSRRWTSWRRRLLRSQSPPFPGFRYGREGVKQAFDLPRGAPDTTVSQTRSPKAIMS
jgi:hypothetical protein